MVDFERLAPHQFFSLSDISSPSVLDKLILIKNPRKSISHHRMYKSSDSCRSPSFCAPWSPALPRKINIKNMEVVSYVLVPNRVRKSSGNSEWLEFERESDAEIYDDEEEENEGFFWLLRSWKMKMKSLTLEQERSSYIHTYIIDWHTQLWCCYHCMCDTVILPPSLKLKWKRGLNRARFLPRADRI